MKLFLKCLFAPRLYKIYGEGTSYEPVRFEKWGDQIILTASTIFNISIYTTPFICMYIYKKGVSVLDDNKFGLIRLFGSIGCLIALSYVIRGIGRAYNKRYVEFVEALTSPMTDKKGYLEKIRKYDFEFHAWPATYNMAPMSTSKGWSHPFANCANQNLPLYQRTPIQILAFFATHAFGLRLIYPGSLGIIFSMFWTPLFQGRAQLVENYGGQRTKIKTADGNNIDTMFVDNRARSPKGKILVVCCEGNSGFYEIGIMTTPIRAGYSALGWNHPGFAGSTGLPYPSQEENAIDAVMQYAINELNFKPEQVVMFGWSIGGYPATWAAINYPVKALILDATFDDLLPLAENVMPTSWSLLVKEVVRSYVDLNIAEMMKSYSGPLQLVRRTDDEIICLSPGVLSTNRGNYLIASVIENRHPLDKDMDINAWRTALTKYIETPEVKRPTDLSELNEYEKRAVTLITEYMQDYRSTHCTPLPVDIFQNIMNKLAK